MVTTVPPPTRPAPTRPGGSGASGTSGPSEPRAGRGLLAGVAAGCLLAGLGAGLVVAGRAPAATGEPVAAHPTATVTVTAHPHHRSAGTAAGSRSGSGHRGEARPGHAGRPRTTIPGDGTFRVGTDVEPGLYAARPVRTICYWSRLHDLRGRLGSIAANGVSRGRAVLRVEPGDRYVQTSGCTTWHRL